LAGERFNHGLCKLDCGRQRQPRGYEEALSAHVLAAMGLGR
jgi:hypothetical protein